MLCIYDSHSQQKKPFTPITKGKIRLYVCGITVYDDCHIGHARTTTAFDIVYRYLRFRGYDVSYVRNITDIDDKIISRANENQQSTQALTEHFIARMHEDFARLHLLPPTIEPKATESMAQIIAMIETLIAKGFAYAADNGDVYYKVSAFKSYGALSHQALDQLREGARVAVADHKQDPLDFVLWKAAKPGEPAWESPWGQGRPGWHIECSAMACHHLAPSIDIHGGGHDLLFPHHENERAQSEAANDQPFVGTWMHVGFVNVDEEKMSKSLGNFFTIRDVLKRYHPEVIRYFLIASHYLSPVNYSEENLEQALHALTRLYTALRGVSTQGMVDQEAIDAFTSAMDDDFNTPVALSVLFDIAKKLNVAKEQKDESAQRYAATLQQLGSVLGLFNESAESFLKGSDQQDEQIERLIVERIEARKQRDWAKADAIRDQLDAMGVVLEDGGTGTLWRRK